MGPGYHKCIGVGVVLSPCFPWSCWLLRLWSFEPKTPNARAKWLLPAQTACPQFYFIYLFFLTVQLA